MSPRPASLRMSYGSLLERLERVPGVYCARAQGWCSQPSTSIHGTTFLGNGDTIFLSHQSSNFSFSLHITIVHRRGR
jgi:hypothetical protein